MKRLPTLVFWIVSLIFFSIWIRRALTNEWLKGACTVAVQYNDREHIFERIGCYKTFPEMEEHE